VIIPVPKHSKTWQRLAELAAQGNPTSYGTSRCAYFFFSEVMTQRAHRVIELGTGSGESAEAFLLALELTRGHLWTVDIRPCDDVVKRLRKQHGKRFTFYQGDSLDFAVEWDRGKADIVFIDTSHTYEQTLKELEAFALLLKDGGTMFLHDVLAHITYDDPQYGVMQAIEEWLKTNTGWEFKFYYTPYGLGILKHK